MFPPSATPILRCRTSARVLELRPRLRLSDPHRRWSGCDLHRSFRWPTSPDPPSTVTASPALTRGVSSSPRSAVMASTGIAPASTIDRFGGTARPPPPSPPHIRHRSHATMSSARRRRCGRGPQTASSPRRPCRHRRSRESTGRSTRAELLRDAAVGLARIPRANARRRQVDQNLLGVLVGTGSVIGLSA